MSDPTTIQVRTNLYLWLLTGRSGDFVNESLNTGIKYSVSDTPEEVTAMRQLLHLDDTTTDFFVLAALAAARMSTSFIRTLPHENDSVFVNGFLTLPGVSSSSTMLAPDSNSWPSIDGGRAGKDGFTSLTFERTGTGIATITTSAGGSDTTNYAVAAADGGGFRLSFSKSESYGIKAHFSVDSWDLGDEVAVNFSPTRYPFKDVAVELQRNGEAKRLMNSEGTMQAYGETSNPARKVGMASLAVIRRMLKHINDDQSGFTITPTYDADGAEPLQRLYEIDPTFSGDVSDPVVGDLEPAGFDV